ncbi:unnamed protein product [Chrysoparadoxa australica]
MTNFEMVVTHYPYLALAFTDDSPESIMLRAAWERASVLVQGNEGHDVQFAFVNSTLRDIAELVDVYDVKVPGARVFRNGMLYDYAGPYDMADAIAAYVIEDSKPAVRRLWSTAAVQNLGRGGTRGDDGITHRHRLVGFFPESFADTEFQHLAQISMDAWSQFHAAADALRGAAYFGVVTDDALALRYGITKPWENGQLPRVAMFTEGSELPTWLKGPITERGIMDWVLSTGAQGLRKLTRSTPAEELFASRFFASNQLKVIAFIRSGQARRESNDLRALERAASSLSGTVLFAYVVEDSFVEVSDYFGVDTSHLPVIIAHDRLHEQRFVKPFSASINTESILTFIGGVLDGAILPIPKSEPVPSESVQGPVIKVVGSNVIELVSQPGVDVLLEVYAPWCEHSKALRPTYEMLGKAFQAEKRVIVSKIDGTANDLPQALQVQGYPTLFWFPAKDKPYRDHLNPVPQPYWDEGFSLHELVGFMLQEGSFSPRSLKVATAEQMALLLEEEVTLRDQLQQDERWHLRNDQRIQHPLKMIDWLVGEIVFDGRRWHIGLLVCIFAWGVRGWWLRLSTHHSPKKTN